MDYLGETAVYYLPLPLNMKLGMSGFLLCDNKYCNISGMT